MLNELFQAVLGWIAAHPGWMGFFILFTAFGEAVAVFGLLVPGAMLMFGFGALVSLGYLEFWPACAWATAGGLLGDCTSYWMGRTFHQRLRLLWPFSRHPEMLVRSEHFFRRHGGKGLLFGRFFGPVRGIVPAVAGMFDMAFPRFLLFSVIAAVLWAPAYLLPGAVFAASLELASQVAFRLALLILLLVAVLWLTARLVVGLFRLLHPRVRAWRRGFYAWSRERPLIGPVVASLLDPEQQELRGLTAIAVIMLSAATLIALLLNVADRGLPTAVDKSLYHFLQDLRTPWADNLMVSITQLGDGPVKLALAVAVFAWLYGNQNRAAALHWLIALGFGLLTNTLVKVLFRVARPVEDLYGGFSIYAFPSNHVTMTTILFGFLAVLIARETEPERRWIPYLGAALVIASIAFSRVYLGAHWLSDVLGGLSMGLLWVALVGMAYSRRAVRPVDRGGLLLVSITALGVSLLTYASLRHDDNLLRYRPQPALQILAQADWWQQGWQALPRYRTDFYGEYQQPLALQWAGSRREIETRLQQGGWQPAPPLTWKSALLFLYPGVSMTDLPLLPRVHDGHHEDFALIHESENPDNRWVLRFWDSGIRLADGQAPVWLGGLNLQHMERRLNFFAFAKAIPNVRASYSLLAPAVQGLRRRTVGTPGWDEPVTLVAPPD